MLFASNDNVTVVSTLDLNLTGWMDVDKLVLINVVRNVISMYM